MICGIGLDICQIARIGALLEDGRFLARYYAPQEIAYLHTRGAERAASAAACFAAKEAFLKAAGSGLGGAPLVDIMLLHDESRRPYLALGPQAQALVDRLGVQGMHVSVTHEGDVAAAVVILEGTDHA